MSSPEKFRRNEHGLLESVDYVFNNDGSVNWRAMITSEQLHPEQSTTAIISLHSKAKYFSA